MVKVQIPLITPAEKGSANGKSDKNKHSKKASKSRGSKAKVKDEEPEIVELDGDGDEDEQVDDDGVGVMSDIEESDVDDDIGDPDWEEVKGQDDDDDEFSFGPGKMSDLPENGVTISIGPPRRSRRAKKRGRKGAGGEDEDESGEELGSDDEVVKKKKKKMDINEMIRKSINRVKITEQLMQHKMSLLIYLARGLRLVRVANCNVIRGLSMSVVDNRFKLKSKMKDRKFLETFMEQFNDVIALNTDDEVRVKHLQRPFMVNLLECFSNCEATSLLELVVMFIACLKAIRPKMTMRIVNVLRPISLRADIIPKPSEKDIEVIDLEADVKTEADASQDKATSKAKTKKETAAKKKQEPADYSSSIERLDYWIEVFLGDEERWCCVDLCNCKLDEPTLLTELSRPFNYLVTFDVDRNCVKAAERNYCDNWYTPGFRKGRCEDKWWDSVLAKLGPARQSEKDQADETKTEEILTNKDMPTSDNGFRRHPLYVLEKHLLKFEGIYPPEVAPLGFFKEQPIYPRDCVRTLRSRETWLREARTVKLGETAYKIVKSRPKRDKYTGDLIRDLPLEIFGEWQTQEYDPPSAVDGKVPRNCYGNVDMYKECMLPKGCVWLKLPGIVRVAHKLGIDCAPAVVGFDTNCGSYGAHPVIDGHIVCEEHAETLQIAWEEEQRNAHTREQDKRLKKIWDNWRRLIKAAMIREKLRVKYKHS